MMVLDLKLPDAFFDVRPSASERKLDAKKKWIGKKKSARKSIGRKQQSQVAHCPSKGGVKTWLVCGCTALYVVCLLCGNVFHSDMCGSHKPNRLYTGEKRRMAIERANKMLYDDSDRVKSFHANLLLSDVLKEREAQIEVTRQKKKNERRRDKYWAEMQTEAMTEYDFKEVEKREEEKRRKHEVTIRRMYAQCLQL